MEIADIIAVLRRNGLTIREIAAVADVPKSTVHRLLRKQPYIPVIRNDPVILEGHKFLRIHFPHTFYCPGCGLEQNHSWLCVECGEFIPAECEESEACAKGFNIKEFVWGQRV